MTSWSPTPRRSPGRSRTRPRTTPSSSTPTSSATRRAGRSTGSPRSSAPSCASRCSRCSTPTSRPATARSPPRARSPRRSRPPRPSAARTRPASSTASSPQSCARCTRIRRPHDRRRRHDHARRPRGPPRARGRAAAHRRPVARRRRRARGGLRRAGVAGLGRARADGARERAGADPGPGLAALVSAAEAPGAATASGYPDALRADVERYLETLRFTREAADTAGLETAMRYSLLAGGKRIRPVLAMATARALGTDPESVLPLAAAIELIHTYSLIHDDLPAMDDDDLRRGRPTCHIKYGEDVAILAGDGLYAEAFRHVLHHQAGEPRNVLAAVCELAAATGVEGMVGGQYIDVT